MPDLRPGKTPKTTQAYCTCWRYCRGGKWISRTAWYNHATHRAQAQPPSDSQLGDSESAVAEETLTHRDKRRRTENSVSGPPASCESTGDVDGNRDLILEDQETSAGGFQREVSTSPEDAATQHEGSGSAPAAVIGEGSQPGESAASGTGGLMANGASGTQAQGATPVGEEQGRREVEEVERLVELSRIQDVRISQQFIDALRNANLRNGDLNEAELEDLLNPPRNILEVDETKDRELLLCLRLYLSHILSSQRTYSETIDAIKLAHPEDDLLSFDQIKRRVRQMTGVRSIVKHMCPNSCAAYTGPFSGQDKCPKCDEPRYESDGTTPRQEFHTLPIGYVIQALKRDPETAKEMEYFNKKTKECLEELKSTGEIECLDDIWCGTDLLQYVHEGKLGTNDTPLMMSFDGAQIYRNKQSDCWIYIWVFIGLSPCKRYKRKFVIPGGFIPGPNKPKVVDSFLFPGLHHVAAVNKEGGLPVWDAYRDVFYLSLLQILLGTADGPGMTYLNGFVGHSGKIGCRLWCGLVGRRKDGGSHYYPVLFKPTNYHVEGCNHPDSDPKQVRQIDTSRYQADLKRVVASTSQAAFEENRRETGICKPSIFSGLEPYILGIPNMFPGDIMHLILNLADLLIPLWRGTFDCASTDSKESWTWATLRNATTWKNHGLDVARSQPYLPGSFGRPPRNPAEKINSGYKCWEFLLYIFGLGPGLLYGILPPHIWASFCRLVSGIRTIYQKKITTAEYKSAHRQLILFTSEFERDYVHRRADRIHFVRQSVHSLSHQVPEAIRVGPGAASSQWTMERSIGDHTEEIRQHADIYAHLSQIGLRRARINTLKAMIPALDPTRDKDGKLPRGAIGLGGGYVLLRKMDKSTHDLNEHELSALRSYILSQGVPIPDGWESCSVVRWARLRLPNQQVARSAWIEERKGDVNIRMARNVKLPRLNGKLEFGEVQYYFRFDLPAEGSAPDSHSTHTIAMVRLFERPDGDLLKESHLTVWSCRKGSLTSHLRAVAVKEIEATVAMVPHSVVTLGEAWADRYFVVEKPGLDIAEMGGALDESDEDEEEE